MPELKYSEDIGRYFEELENKAKQCYSIAKKAREKGYDPKTDVEIPMAEDLAVRCQELTGIMNTADKIRELTDEYGNREEVALLIAKEVANREGDKRKRLEDAIRIGLAVLTEGILVAPLEGIGDVQIKGGGTGEDYAELSFAGPIRSAGGTGQAMSVLIADVVRRELGIGAYKPTPSEIQRYKEEIPLYKKAKSLQYTPSAEEIEMIVKGCPVSISGEGTEREEVSGNRNLPRVDTDRLRGGACLVIAEGMTLKAKKLKKHVDKLGIEGWEFLDEYISKYSSGKKDDDEKDFKGVKPNFKYIKETIAGRPVFGHPSEKGGFRLRYGRSRTLGLAAIAVNPATMYLTDEFMAIGTQVKTERPGKAGAVTPCDTIEGPTILLKNGEVVRVHTKEKAVKLKSNVKEIIDLGEILIPYGEFLENNHKLVPGAYCHEWWVQEVDEEFYPEEIDAEMAVKLSVERGYPLHPKFIYMWHYTEKGSIEELRGFISQNGTVEDGKLVLENDEDIKSIMEDVGIPHRRESKKLFIDPYKPLLLTLGLNMDDLSIEGEGGSSDIWEYLSEISGIKVRNKGPTFIGARMARPEKAKERKMDPPVHGLFPVGDAGGSQRLVSKAVDKGIIDVTVSARRCTSCGKSGPLIRCSCGGRCEIIEEPQNIKIPMSSIFKQARKTLGEGGNIKKIKGVKGMINKTKTPEGLEKGILRAKHNIYVFKDGTSRYDMTDLPITHFKPKEIGLSIQKARELGYDHDIHGEELTEEDQIVEIKPQDVIASTNSAEYLIKISNFIDDLLEKYYGMDKFYEAKFGEDLIGELVVGLAPHTSGGVLGRLIGFHKGRAGYAHPYFHAAKRRNCFSPDTNIWVRSHDEWELKSIKEVVEENLCEGNLNSDDFGTEYKSIDGMLVPSISKDGEEELRKVTHVSKHPAPGHNIKFRTRAGRTIMVTPQHKMLRWDDNLEFCYASEIEKGDKIPAPKQINIDGRNVELDLLKELSEIPSIKNQLMIRKVPIDYLKKLLIKGLSSKHYLKKLSERVDLNKKTISSYVQRASFPFWILKKIFGKEIYKILPENLELGIKRDNINIKRYLRVDEDFCRVMGYYAAEGFSRKKRGGFYQITICSPDKPARALIKKVFESHLGVKAFDENKWKVTVSSNLIYRLFNGVLKVGKNAHDKRIPPHILTSTDNCLSAFLSCYFSGDGSTSSKRLDIRANTVSHKLAHEIVYSLKRFGINSKLYKEKRGVSGIVKKFYIDNNIDHENKIFTSYIIKITSENTILFNEKIGFDLNRKSKALSNSIENSPVRSQRMMTNRGDIWLDEIEDISIVEKSSDYVYSLTVEENNTLIANDLYLGQCDGDEDCVMLLMDGLLNFSEDFLPEKRGGKMDAPLVLTTRINPSEIDKEAHNVDTMWKYPLEFYERAMDYPNPKDLTDIMETVDNRLGTNEQYEGFGYTHETSDISQGPETSRYTRLKKMTDKMEAQVKVAQIIRAVDTDDVVRRVISDHFIPDMIGNFNKFCVQTVRCTGCNKKYRRPPLSGKCTCGGNLTLTVHKGGVKKYLDHSLKMVRRFDLPVYLEQRVEQIASQIDSLFENDNISNPSLDEFC